MKENRNKFILLGNTRIKVGNIKDYGISNERVRCEKIYRLAEGEKNGLLAAILRNTDLVWEEEVEELTPIREYQFEVSDIDHENRAEFPRATTYKRYRNKNGKVVDSHSIATMDDSVIEIKRKYLYISTFQKDNFRFYEDEVDFDIIKKCCELDNLLCI